MPSANDSGVMSFRLIFWFMIGLCLNISGKISFCSFWLIFSVSLAEMKRSVIMRSSGTHPGHRSTSEAKRLSSSG